MNTPVELISTINHKIDAKFTTSDKVLQKHTAVQPCLVLGDLCDGIKGFCYNYTTIVAGTIENDTTNTPQQQ